MTGQRGIAVPEDDGQHLQTSPNLRTALQREIGETYVPPLRANAQAAATAEEAWRAKIAGAQWLQQSCPYQKKCRVNLPREFSALLDTDKLCIHQMIEGTGCDARRSKR